MLLGTREVNVDVKDSENRAAEIFEVRPAAVNAAVNSPVG